MNLAAPKGIFEAYNIATIYLALRKRESARKKKIFHYFPLNSALTNPRSLGHSPYHQVHRNIRNQGIQDEGFRGSRPHKQIGRIRVLHADVLPMHDLKTTKNIIFSK